VTDFPKLDRLRLDVPETLTATPTRIRKRQKHFIQLPFSWYERLKSAGGQTYRVALFICYESWKRSADKIKVPSGMLEIDGVPPKTKRWALRDLERRGCISVEWRPNKSPIVRLLP